MEIKYGAFRIEKLKDGFPKHIYMQSINAHSCCDNDFFKKVKHDVNEFVQTGFPLEIIFLLTGEPLTDADNGDLLIEFQEFCNGVGAKFILVLSTESSQYKTTYLRPIKNLYDLDLQLLCYDNMKKCIAQSSNTVVAPRSGILHLTGKPNKVQRIGLLYQCYLDGLQERFTSSAWLPKDKNSWVNRMLGISEDEYTKFTQKISSRSIDAISVRTNHDHSNLHYFGMPYDRCIYENTFCSLINETWIHSPRHITEKTWRTIDNVHPFVLVGSPGTVSYLESVGFDCFRKFLTYPDYDDFARDHRSGFSDLQPWFKQILRNCMDLDNLSGKEKEKVMAIALENKQNMDELINKNKKKLVKFYNLDEDSFFDATIIKMA